MTTTILSWLLPVAVPALFLIAATFARELKGIRYTFYALTFFVIVAEGGCGVVAAGIGAATSGAGENDSPVMLLSVLALLIALIWAFVLELMAQKRWWKKEQARRRGRLN